LLIFAFCSGTSRRRTGTQTSDFHGLRIELHGGNRTGRLLKLPSMAEDIPGHVEIWKFNRNNPPDWNPERLTTHYSRYSRSHAHSLGTKIHVATALDRAPTKARGLRMSLEAKRGRIFVASNGTIQSMQAFSRGVVVVRGFSSSESSGLCSLEWRLR
jgi:hypothetical protein